MENVINTELYEILGKLKILQKYYASWVSLVSISLSPRDKGLLSSATIDNYLKKFEKG